MTLQGVNVGQVPFPPPEYDEANEGDFRDTMQRFMDDVTAWMQQRTDDTTTGVDFMPPTGRYFRPGLASAAAANNGVALTADELYYVRFVPDRSVDIDVIGINVSTAVASSVARAGIYTDSDGAPSTLVVESANFDTSTTGAKTDTLSTAQALTAGTTYWAALVSDGAISVLGESAVAEILPLGTVDTTGAAAATLAHEAIGTWSALPASAGSVTWTSGSIPNINMRVG